MIIAGQKYGRLLAIGPENGKPSRSQRWWFVCDCGIEKVIRADGVNKGAVVSCGCYAREKLIQRLTKTGLSKSPEYKVWGSMKARCSKPQARFYYLYGGRGIKVCERWMKFENFIADMGRRPPGMTLERIDSKGDYCPENCKWATVFEQNANTSRNVRVVLNGETLIMSEACRRIKIGDASVYRRARNHHVPVQTAFDHFAAQRMASQ